MSLVKKIVSSHVTGGGTLSNGVLNEKLTAKVRAALLPRVSAGVPAGKSPGAAPGNHLGTPEDGLSTWLVGLFLLFN